MNKNSLLKDVVYQENRPSVKVLMESPFTKEISIAFKPGQVMKEHQTPFPIVVHIIEGTIDFGIQGEVHHLEKGDIISLEGGIPHDLKALTTSIVRLTLSTLDESKRVKNVANQ
ncbi:MAG TPA: cupin [Microscillaceae bacterium]|nr:cupin [Microscillaceae bacterium]